MTLIEQLQLDVTTRFGLQPRSSWTHELSVALKDLQSAYQLDEAELLKRIDGNQDLRRELAGNLTIGESYFYRHTEHFAIFAEHLSDRLAGQCTKPIVVWSAGCARGEEPYSIAMTVCEHFGPALDGRLTVFGIDLNRKAIDEAHKAVYTNWSFRELPGTLLKRYFRAREDGRFEVLQPLRTNVHFINRSIEEFAATQPTGTVDVIFFRNVAIYLDEATLQRTYEIFHRILREGGLLMLAPADPRPPTELFALQSDRSISVFRPNNGNASKAIRRKSRHADVSQKRPGKVKIPEPAPSKVSETSTGIWLAQVGDELLERGEFATALRAASALIEQQPASKAGYLLRARIHFANEAIDAAMRDLRSVVFVDPADKIARYCYAQVLRCAGAIEQSDNQLRELELQLKRMSPEDPLEDGHTFAGELLRAVTVIRKVST
jgi:chemotaxis protein methyltransferase CheR